MPGAESKIVRHGQCSRMMRLVSADVEVDEKVVHVPLAHDGLCAQSSYQPSAVLVQEVEREAAFFATGGWGPRGVRVEVVNEHCQRGEVTIRCDEALHSLHCP
jgi:hypothetical protein